MSNKRFTQLRRCIQHVNIANACQAVDSAPPSHLAAPQVLLDACQTSKAVRDTTSTFLDLYDARVEADYDHDSDLLAQATVLTQTSRVADAIDQLRKERKNSSPGLAAFCTLVGSNATGKY